MSQNQPIEVSAKTKLAPKAISGNVPRELYTELIAKGFEGIKAKLVDGESGDVLICRPDMTAAKCSFETARYCIAAAKTEAELEALLEAHGAESVTLTITSVQFGGDVTIE